MIRIRNELNQVYINDEKNVLIGQVKFPQIGEHKVMIQKVEVVTNQDGLDVVDRLMTEVVKRLRKEEKVAYVACPIARAWFDEHESCKDVLMVWMPKR